MIILLINCFYVNQHLFYKNVRLVCLNVEVFLFNKLQMSFFDKMLAYRATQVTEKI